MGGSFERAERLQRHVRCHLQRFPQSAADLLAQAGRVRLPLKGFGLDGAYVRARLLVRGENDKELVAQILHPPDDVLHLDGIELGAAIDDQVVVASQDAARRAGVRPAAGAEGSVQPGGVVGPVPDHRRSFPRQVGDDQDPRFPLRYGTKGFGVNDLDQVMVLGPVKARFGRAFAGVGGVDLADAVKVESVDPQARLDLRAGPFGLRPALPSEQPDAERDGRRVHHLLPHALGDVKGERGGGQKDRRAGVLEIPDLPIGQGGPDGDHEAPEKVGRVVDRQAGDPQAIAEGVLNDVSRPRPGLIKQPRGEAGDGLDVVGCPEGVDGMARCAGGGMELADLGEGGEHVAAERGMGGLLVAELLLADDGEAREVVQAPEVPRLEPGRLELLAIEGRPGMAPPDLLLESRELERPQRVPAEGLHLRLEECSIPFGRPGVLRCPLWHGTVALRSHGGLHFEFLSPPPRFAAPGVGRSLPARLPPSARNTGRDEDGGGKARSSPPRKPQCALTTPLHTNVRGSGRSF